MDVNLKENLVIEALDNLRNWYEKLGLLDYFELHLRFRDVSDIYEELKNDGYWD